jgi:hypothetical protein
MWIWGHFGEFGLDLQVAQCGRWTDALSYGSIQVLYSVSMDVSSVRDLSLSMSMHARTHTRTHP